MDFRKDLKFLINCVITTLLFVSYNSFAVVLHGNIPINNAVTYTNTTLDLPDGRFELNAGGTLDVENCIINVTISPSNPYFILMNEGDLTFKNNIVKVSVSGINQNREQKAVNQLFRVLQGKINITRNTFTINQPFSVGFLDTLDGLTDAITIKSNVIKYFHGGAYLSNTQHAIIDDNTFSFVSFSNVFNNGNMSRITNNVFDFPGNLNDGNAIDIIESNGVNVIDNVIASSSSYGIFIMGGQNINIENNKITDGKSYAIFIQTSNLSTIRKNHFIARLLPKKKFNFQMNSNIVINQNYMALNRYGLAGLQVDGLIVTNNYFIQRFDDASTRQYWTNNDVLLPDAINVTWLNNTYKEAFTQDNSGVNTPALKLVTFPAHGGVFINP